MWEADDSQDLWATPGNSPAASMAHGERMVGSELTPEDLDVDRTLRPSAWTTTAVRSISSRACACSSRRRRAVARRSTT